MGLETEGKKVMLEAFGTMAVKAALYDETGTELSGSGYAKQIISWTYNSQNVKLNADSTDGIVATFDVPAGTVQSIKYLDTTGTKICASHNFGENAEEYKNPGKLQLTAASLELDPS